MPCSQKSSTPPPTHETDSVKLIFDDFTIDPIDTLPFVSHFLLSALAFGDYVEAHGGAETVALRLGLPLAFVEQGVACYRGHMLPSWLGGGPGSLERIVPILGATLAHLERDPSQVDHCNEVTTAGVAWLVRVAGGATRELRRRLIRDVARRLAGHAVQKGAIKHLEGAFNIYDVDQVLQEQALRLAPTWRARLVTVDRATLLELKTEIAQVEGDLTWDLLVDLVEKIPTRSSGPSQGANGPSTRTRFPPRFELETIMSFFAALGRRVALVLLPVEPARTLVSGCAGCARPGVHRLIREAAQAMANVKEWVQGLPLPVARWVEELMGRQTARGDRV